MPKIHVAFPIETQSLERIKVTRQIKGESGQWIDAIELDDVLDEGCVSTYTVGEGMRIIVEKL